MRKPEPLPGFPEPARKKRTSAAAAMGSSSYKPSKIASDDAESHHTAIAATLPLRGANGGYIDPDEFPQPPPRPGAAAAMYSPGPPTRTTGSTTSGSSTGYSLPSHSSSSTAVEALKRKKSRPQVISDDDDGNEEGERNRDEDSDGADADEEFVARGASLKSKTFGATSGDGGAIWVNLEGRRKALPKRSAAAAAVAAIEDIRRHSMVL